MDEQVTTRVVIELQITLLSSLHIGTGLGRGQILDDTVVAGPHPLAPEAAPLPYIPGSSLKGRLRHSLRLLAPALGLQTDGRLREIEKRLFGFPERPGGLLFADAHIADPRLARSLSAPAMARRTARSERSFVGLTPRRVAADERLFRIELAEHDLVFAARLSGTLPRESARADVGLLLAAAYDLTHLGGHKGRGLGACRVSAPEDGVRLDDTLVAAATLMGAL
jgi:hypothetical protein